MVSQSAQKRFLLNSVQKGPLEYNQREGCAVHSLDGECCPAVVDPVVFYGTLAFLTLGTVFLVSLVTFATVANIIAQIQAFIAAILALLGIGRRRRRRSFTRFSSVMLGRLCLDVMNLTVVKCRFHS